MNSLIPESGNKIIDTQHAKLSRIVAKLTRAWISDTDRTHFHEVATSFLDNLQDHFEAEITIVRAAGFERWPEHQNEHRHIIDKLRKLLNSKTDEHLYRMIDEAEKTIFEHELLHDQKFWEVIEEPQSNELIIWDDSLLVHEAEIDVHHKALASYLNRLYSKIVDSEIDLDVFLQDLKQLYSHTKAHFKYEEKLFNAYEQAELSRAHMREHARLLSELRKTIDAFKADPDIDDPKILMRDFLRYWLIDHIITQDKPCFERSK